MIRSLNNPQIEARYHTMVDHLEKTKERLHELTGQVEQFDSLEKIDENLRSLDQFVISTNEIVSLLHLPSNNNGCHEDGLESVSNQLSVRQLVFWSIPKPPQLCVTPLKHF